MQGQAQVQVQRTGHHPVHFSTPPTGTAAATTLSSHPSRCHVALTQAHWRVLYSRQGNMDALCCRRALHCDVGADLVRLLR